MKVNRFCIEKVDGILSDININYYNSIRTYQYYNNIIITYRCIKGNTFGIKIQKKDIWKEIGLVLRSIIIGTLTVYVHIHIIIILHTGLLIIIHLGLR